MEEKSVKDGALDAQGSTVLHVLRMRIKLASRKLTCACSVLLETPWTVPHQAPLSTGFPRQEDCGRLPFSSPGDLPNPRIECMSLSSLVSPAFAGRFFTTAPPGKSLQEVNPLSTPSPNLE